MKRLFQTHFKAQMPRGQSHNCFNFTPQTPQVYPGYPWGIWESIHKCHEEISRDTHCPILPSPRQPVLPTRFEMVSRFGKFEATEFELSAPSMPRICHACVCVWGWAQAELQSDHGRITDGSRTDHGRITVGSHRFHKLKFKMFIFCDIQFRSARVY